MWGPFHITHRIQRKRDSVSVVEGGNADAVLLTDVLDMRNASILDGSAILSPPLSDDLKVVPVLRYAPQLAADPQSTQSGGTMFF